MSDLQLGFGVYGVLAALYGLSVTALGRQRHRGERAPRRAAASRIAARSGDAATAPAERKAS